jgi:hypothetical protein
MTDYNREGRKRLSIDIPSNLFMKFKILALENGYTTTKWVIGAIQEQIKREESFR